MATNPITFQAIPEGGTAPVDLAAGVLNGGSNYGLHVITWGYTGSLYVPQRVSASGYTQIDPTARYEVFNIQAGTVGAGGTLTLVGTATIGNYYNVLTGGFNANHAGTIVFQWSNDPTMAVVLAQKTFAATASDPTDLMHPNYAEYFHAHFVNSAGAGGTVWSQVYAGNLVF